LVDLTAELHVSCMLFAQFWNVFIANTLVDHGSDSCIDGMFRDN